MQVMIPVMDSGRNKMLVAEGFHTTDVMCVYSSETGKMEWIDTAELSQFTGNFTEELMNRGITSVITNKMSFMALGVFVDGGCTVYQSRGNDLDYNIDLLLKGELEIFTHQNTFRSSSCSSGSCNSCGSTCDSNVS